MFSEAEVPHDALRLYGTQAKNKMVIHRSPRTINYDYYTESRMPIIKLRLKNDNVAESVERITGTRIWNSNSRNVSNVLLEIAVLTNEIADWSVCERKSKYGLSVFVVKSPLNDSLAKVTLRDTDNSCVSVESRDSSKIYRPASVAPIWDRRTLIYHSWRCNDDPPIVFPRVEFFARSYANE
jgi:hypothetical protein